MFSLDLPKATRVAQPVAGVSWMAGGLGAFFPRITADGHLELLVSGRDAQGESRIGSMIFEWADPPRLLHVSEPLLDRGALGAFDMNGAGYPWLVEQEGAQRMFYVGWTRMGGGIPFRNQVGLAERLGVSGPVRRVSRASWFPATDREPIFSLSVRAASNSARRGAMKVKAMAWASGIRPIPQKNRKAIKVTLMLRQMWMRSVARLGSVSRHGW